MPGWGTAKASCLWSLLGGRDILCCLPGVFCFVFLCFFCCFFFAPEVASRPGTSCRVQCGTDRCYWQSRLSLPVTRCDVASKALAPHPDELSNISAFLPYLLMYMLRWGNILLICLNVVFSFFHAHLKINIRYLHVYLHKYLYIFNESWFFTLQNTWRHKDSVSFLA